MRQEPWASVSSLWAEALTAQQREEREFILMLSVEFAGARRAAAKRWKTLSVARSRKKNSRRSVL